MENVKMTKKDWFEALRNIVADSNYEMKEEAIEFIDNEVEQIELKAEKAKLRAQKKREKGDVLRAAVLDQITNDYQTVDEIAAPIVNEEITRSMVVARLSALVKEGLVEKEQTKIGSRRLCIYRTSTASTTYYDEDTPDF